MSLRIVVAAPFRESGTPTMSESEFVVALSLDRDWFTPDQAKRLVDVATGEGLLARTDDGLEATFAVDSVTVADGFVPDEELLTERSPFEQLLDAIVAAGVEKRAAVAASNELQRDLGVTIEAAAAVYAQRQGIDVAEEVAIAREALVGDRDG